MELRIKASEEGYQQIAELAHMIALAKNPQYWFNGMTHNEDATEQVPAISETERLAIISTLESHMAELIS